MTTGSSNADTAQATRRTARRTPLTARGEPAVWLMGLSLVVALALIVGLLSLVGAAGLRTFWPAPVEKLTLRSGEQILGIASRKKSSVEAQPGENVENETLYRVGNQELGAPFRWVSESEVERRETPEWAVVLERTRWRIFVGRIRSVVMWDVREVNAGEAPSAEVDTGVGRGRLDRTVLADLGEGRARVRDRVVLAEGDEASWAKLVALMEQARARLAEQRRIQEIEQGPINRRLEQLRLIEAESRLLVERSSRGDLRSLGVGAWAGLAALTGALLFAWWRLGAKSASRSAPIALRLGRTVLGLAVLGGVIALAAERPWALSSEHPNGFWGSREVTPEAAARQSESIAREREKLTAEHSRWTERLTEIEREDARWRVEIEEGNVPSGAEGTARRIAPERQAEPDAPLRVSQITRAVRPNAVSWGQKASIYLDRWRVFLTTDPLNNGMEGGVWPAIFGTMVLTVLLSIVVVPLGVTAALYLREYARQGWVTSVLRIAVNNLAGVPSIVYGVFGWGFFCYTIGRYIDRGPNAESVLPRFEWWFIFGGLAVIVGSAIALAEWLRRAGDSSRMRPTGGGEASDGGRRLAGWALALLWTGAAALVVTLFATTPYFWGLFAERAPNQVYAGRAVLWGALTLALLTLPVVIVATEEAIAAVPGSMREGSYGCGASKWQTIRRVVLPLAMPGLMTGAILAMARGAGEVAPLMLVGVAPTATELPVSTEFPYLHPERSIMHLAYHVFNVGLHSDDSEAAKPLVWTATLVLVLLVLALNLMAIWLRARVRARAHSIF